MTVEDWKAKFEDLSAETDRLRVEVERLREHEARAVEALRRCHEGAARQLAEPRDHDNDQYALTAIATDCEAVLEAQGPALDWLAQQRAEAVAAWIEKQVAENLERYGTHYYERTTDDLMREAAAFRAAALRAGEVGDE